MELWLGVITYEEWNVVASFSALCFDCGVRCFGGGGGLLFIVEMKGRKREKTKKNTSPFVYGFFFLCGYFQVGRSLEPGIYFQSVKKKREYIN